MIGITDVVVVAAVPFLVAVGAGMLAARSKRLARHAALLGIGLGFIVGTIAMVTRNRAALQPSEFGIAARFGQASFDALQSLWRPRQARDWLPLFALTGIVAGLLDRSLGKRRSLVWLLLFVALPTRLLWGSVYFTSEWSLGGAAWRIALAAGAMWGLWYAETTRGLTVSEARSHESSLHFLLVAVVLATATGWVLLLTGSKTYGELGGVLSAATLGATVVHGVTQRTNQQTAVGLVTLLMGGLFVLGCSFSETRTWQAATLIVAAAVPLIAARYGASRPARWASITIMTMLVLAVCLQAGYRFWSDVQVESSPYGQYR